VVRGSVAARVGMKLVRFELGYGLSLRSDPLGPVLDRSISNECESLVLLDHGPWSSLGVQLQDLSRHRGLNSAECWSQRFGREGRIVSV
jgi:hypothetical protein